MKNETCEFCKKKVKNIHSFNLWGDTFKLCQNCITEVTFLIGLEGKWYNLNKSSKEIKRLVTKANGYTEIEQEKSLMLC